MEKQNKKTINSQSLLCIDYILENTWFTVMCTDLISLAIVIDCYLSRAVLEDLAHGPCPVCSSVRCDDSGQHLPGGLRLQERQVCSQTQVRRMNTSRFCPIGRFYTLSSLYMRLIMYTVSLLKQMFYFIDSIYWGNFEAKQ